MSSAPRTPDEISVEIAEIRNRLAGTIDQLVFRTKPKTIISRQLDSAKAAFRKDDGSLRIDLVVKIVGGAVGVVATVVAIRKLVG